MKPHLLKTIAIVPFLLAGAQAHAAQLKVMASGAMAHALEAISADFAKKNGHTLEFVAGTTGALQDKLRGGDKPDVIEVTSVGMDTLEKEKLVVPGTRVELARALIGVTVPDGAALPDIKTPEALKQRLLSARAVAYIDPKVGGQAGAAIVGMLKEMGITDAVEKKSVYGKTGAEAVQKMVAGQADIAISFTSEILPIKGAKLVGPLPASLQNPSSYAGAIAAGAPNPDAARALLAAMSTPEAHRIMEEAGLEPIAH